jgi:hypothetical protein
MNKYKMLKHIDSETSLIRHTSTWSLDAARAKVSGWEFLGQFVLAFVSSILQGIQI